MKHVLFFFTAISGLSIMACGANKGEELQSQLQTEVMAIHDEIMPKMGDINRISRELRTYLNEHAALPVEQQEKINQIVNSLDQADESMMDWMAAYGGLAAKFKDMSHADIVQALEEEKEKISGLKELMLSSIKAGEEALSELGVK